MTSYLSYLDITDIEQGCVRVGAQVYQPHSAVYRLYRHEQYQHLVDLAYAHADYLEPCPEERPEIPSHLSLRPWITTLCHKHCQVKSACRLAQPWRNRQGYYLHPLEHSHLDVSVFVSKHSPANVLTMTYQTTRTHRLYDLRMWSYSPHLHRPSNQNRQNDYQRKELEQILDTKLEQKLGRQQTFTLEFSRQCLLRHRHHTRKIHTLGI